MPRGLVGTRDTTCTKHTTNTTTELTECEGTTCRHSEATGRARELAVAKTLLCPTCRLRLTHNLRQLPRLYDECGLLLGGSERPRDRTSGGGGAPGLPFNTAAADARSAIIGILRSWAVLVVEERGVGTPPDTVARIAEFLLRHADWLSAHRAAGELSHEVAKAVRRARHVTDPAAHRRVPVGPCVEADCQGGLTAAVRPQRSGAVLEVSCDAQPSHRWSAHEWLRLDRSPMPSRPAPSRQEGTDAAAAAPLVRWMGAQDIALLWGISTGSVYRRASEDRWRRRSRGGRTCYHGEDVHQSLGTRA